MARYIISFLLIVTITLGSDTGFGASSRYTDNEYSDCALIREWQAIKENKEAGRELKNIMTALNEYYTRKPLEFRKEVAQCIQEVGRENGLDPALLLAMILTESSFRENARSKNGALGFMQLLPSTGHAISRELRIEWKGRKTLYDAGHNIRMGAHYLKKLLNRFNDLDIALTAYNAGPSRVLKYMRRGKTYSQTYAKKVSRHCKMFTTNYFCAES
ncbi:MAG: hypothetical protein BA873_14245 [Desulfobulbaceae bacterium C00003063]|nr:MAG: hypothetical protein BA873_14245 [Desulfobulbaceae bacterium C00003063]OEU84728.1 MAG: hypothetical protein BA865_01035 [Desulfobacterales bacterium S5133MH4]